MCSCCVCKQELIIALLLKGGKRARVWKTIDKGRHDREQNIIFADDVYVTRFVFCFCF